MSFFHIRGLLFFLMIYLIIIYNSEKPSASFSENLESGISNMSLGEKDQSLSLSSLPAEIKITILTHVLEPDLLSLRRVNKEKNQLIEYYVEHIYIRDHDLFPKKINKIKNKRSISFILNPFSYFFEKKASSSELNFIRSYIYLQYGRKELIPSNAANIFKKFKSFSGKEFQNLMPIKSFLYKSSQNLIKKYYNKYCQDIALLALEDTLRFIQIGLNTGSAYCDQLLFRKIQDMKIQAPTEKEKKKLYHILQNDSEVIKIKTPSKFLRRLLPHILNVQQPKYLSLKDMEISDVNLLDLGSNLKILNLSYNNIGNESCKHMMRIPNLNKLIMKYNFVGDRGAYYLSQYSSLRYLNLNHNQVGNKGLKYLLNSPFLRQLFLTKNPLNNIGQIKNFTPDSHLVELDLSDNNIGNSGLKILEKITSLKTLHLAANDIDNKGTQLISKNQFIENLDLSHNQIGSRGALHLCSMKQLKYLNLDNNHIKKESRELLSQKLPSTYITFEDN